MNCLLIKSEMITSILSVCMNVCADLGKEDRDNKKVRMFLEEH